MSVTIPILGHQPSKYLLKIVSEYK